MCELFWLIRSNDNSVIGKLENHRFGRISEEKLICSDSVVV
jgi:hypothetical protein